MSPTEESGISQEQGCLGTPATLSQWLGAAREKCGQHKHSEGFQSSSGSVTVNDCLHHCKSKLNKVILEEGGPLIQHDQRFYKVGEFGHRLTHRQGQRRVKMKAERGDASSSQRMSEITSKPPEARRETWNRFSLKALRRNQSCRHLGLRLLDSRTMRWSSSVVQDT